MLCFISNAAQRYSKNLLYITWSIIDRQYQGLKIDFKVRNHRTPKLSTCPYLYLAWKSYTKVCNQTRTRTWKSRNLAQETDTDDSVRWVSAHLWPCSYCSDRKNYPSRCNFADSSWAIIDKYKCKCIHFLSV